jgi:AcrR family transcriptional regulator
LDLGDAYPSSRSERKRRAILSAAETLFLERGYLGTTMDEIAALAVVSKQTVYKHFADKERLFIEIVTTTVNEVSDPVAEEVLALRHSESVEEDLRQLGAMLLTRVMEPRLLALRRLVIGESGRFPELGRAFYERGPGRTIAALAVVFETLAARGTLTLDDPRAAAGHFNWLIMSISTASRPTASRCSWPRTARAHRGLTKVRGVAGRRKAPPTKPRCELPM